jgi:predicted ribosomally synthesized peptide with SipW-like signal peptide
MKEILKSPKFKIIAITLALSALISACISGSIAYFTDSKSSTSVYTAGNVYIQLSEAAVKLDNGGNLIENTEADRIMGGEINENGASVVHDYGVIFPGQTIYKDPTIKNVGSSDAWVAGKVIVEDGECDIFDLYKYSDLYQEIDIEGFLSGGLLAEPARVGTWNGIEDVCYNENFALIPHGNRAAGVYEFFFIILKPLASGDSVTLFDHFYVDGSFNNIEMQQFRELKITVQAFAVQKFGFDSCYKAMNEAFANHFVNATTETP